MEAVVYQSELELLEQRSREALQAALRSIPFRVRCGVQDGKLIMLAQHRYEDNPHRELVFHTLERTFRDVHQELETLSANIFSVLIYLRRVSQYKPYAAYGFAFHVGSSVPPCTNSRNTGEGSDTPPPADDAIEVAVTGTTGRRGDLVLASEAMPTAPIQPEYFAVYANLETPSGRERSPIDRFLTWFSHPLVAAGTAVSVMLVGTAGYMLTRPCVIGRCVPLQTAYQLNQEALQTVQRVQSAQEVVTAYDQLVEATYLLNTIPSWSGQYQTAQSLMRQNEQQMQMVEHVVLAQRRAMTAAEMSQEPPHPLLTWREIQQIWREAIAHLQQVPVGSPVSTLAATKQTEYEANLAMINRRIQIEQQAQQRVSEARKTAKVAEARNGIATSLDHWQLTHATWAVVVDLLKQVPKTTMAHAEAQQLLALYQPRLMEVRTRLRQEEVAAANYNRALSLATAAQRLERQNQWSQAVSQWQNALTQAQQVPAGTTHFDQAQPLLNSYRSSLASAREKLRVAVSTQSAQGDLGVICNNTPRICTYNQTGDRIRVYITPEYSQLLQQAATYQGNSMDLNSAMTTQLNPLLLAIANVSEASQVSIELYNADGSLFGTYDPRLRGYVPPTAERLPR